MKAKSIGLLVVALMALSLAAYAQSRMGKRVASVSDFLTVGSSL